MVTTKAPARNPLWGEPMSAPWITPAVIDSYRSVGTEGVPASTPVPSATGDGLVSDEPPTPKTRRNAAAAQHAIREATGATVDVSARSVAPERPEAVYMSGDESVSDYEPAVYQPAPRPPIRSEATVPDPAAAKRARRNERDRAKRLRAFKSRVTNGATHHGPKPRGA